jgi:hypothetical protein
VAAAVKRAEGAEERLREAEDRAAALSASKLRQREALDTEIAALTAKVAGGERALTLAQEAVANLTGELEVGGGTAFD